MSNHLNKQFLTSNFYTAVFLFIKGLELIDVKKTEQNRSTFVFLDTPERDHFIKVFNFSKENSPEVMIDFRNAINAIKTIKNKLYQGEGGING